MRQDVVNSLVVPMSSCSKPGSAKQKILRVVAIAWGILAPLQAFAESNLPGTVVNAPARIEKATNLAAGNDNRAGQASVVMKNVDISGNVANSVKSQGSTNLAIGNKNLANQGSISIGRAAVEGNIVNTAASKATVNMAAGSNNKADQAGIRVEGGKVRGTVMNSATLQKSANIAVGANNRASQGAVVLQGTQLRGVVSNSASGDGAANIAIGQRNEASQASIVVDGGGSATFTSTGTLPPSSTGVKGQYGAVAYSGKLEPSEEKKNKTAQHVPGQVIFLVNNDQSGRDALARVAKKYRLAVEEQNPLSSLNRLMVVASARGDVAEIADALKKEAGISNPQPNYVFATMGEKDPLSSMQNLSAMLDLPRVHATATGKNITVAVVDTGVEVDHQDLHNRMIGHHNFISGSPYRGEIHGTAVAGIIGAEENENGIVGIAPQVSLLALRACRQVGKTTAIGECFSTSLALSLDTAISAKVQVVNLSIGAYVNDSLLGAMIDTGHGKGIVFAAPVGNDPNAEKIAFPASHEKVISVAGIDEQGNPLPNKELAAKADAVAPATHLFVTTPGNGYNFLDGTSLASASVSGIVALALERQGRYSSCLSRYGDSGPWGRKVKACLGIQ